MCVSASEDSESTLATLASSEIKALGMGSLRDKREKALFDKQLLYGKQEDQAKYKTAREYLLQLKQQNDGILPDPFNQVLSESQLDQLNSSQTAPSWLTISAWTIFTVICFFFVKHNYQKIRDKLK